MVAVLYFTAGLVHHSTGRYYGRSIVQFGSVELGYLDKANTRVNKPGAKPYGTMKSLDAHHPLTNKGNQPEEQPSEPA